MVCDICGKKKATVHLTEIVDGQMTEMHLCEECAHHKSVQMEQQFGLADLLAGLSDFGKQVVDHQQEKLKCAHCGLTYDDFKKFGRLGCSECYTGFREQLSGLLKKIHGSNRHYGKAPVTLSKFEQDKNEVLRDLRSQLEQAVHKEDFESAAELRDQIRDLEKGSEGKNETR